MRIALCNEVVAGLPFERQCDLAARLGYDGLEIAPFTLIDDPDRLSDLDVARIRRTAADAGLAITSLHYLLRAPQGLSITAPDPSIRERTLAVMRRLCALAAELGARVLVHGSPDQRRLQTDQLAESRKRGIEAFAAAAGFAEQCGVTYCVEALSRDQTDFIHTVEEAAAIICLVASPSLRTMIDCSSATRTEAETIPDLIRRWVPTGLIAHVHLNDPNRRGPGEGALAFAPILAALRETHYRGDAAIEPFVYEPDGQTCAARGIGYVRGILEALA